MIWHDAFDAGPRKWILGGAAALAAILPFRVYLLAPRTEDNVVVRQRIENLERQNRHAAASAIGGNARNGRDAAAYRRHVDKLEELIPAVEEVAQLTDDVAASARRLGVELRAMTPEAAEPGPFYDRTSYQITAIGEYHAVARFLTTVASLSRILTPADVDVLPFEESERFSEMEMPVQAMFRIVTYVLPGLKSSSPPAGAPTPAPDPAAPQDPALPSSAGTRLVFEREVFEYPVQERRNPFRPLAVTGADGSHHKKLRLSGIIRPLASGRAIAVFSTAAITPLEDGTLFSDGGQSYYARIGEMIGNVKVVGITAEAVVVEVREFGQTNRNVMRFPDLPGGG